MEKTEVGRGELVVPGEDAPVVLNLVDEALHQVALFVQMSSVFPQRLPVGSGRDDGTAPRSRITWTKVSASYPLSAITYSMGAERSSASA